MMIGKLVSHYEIIEKLGEGGMGVVYKAEDTKLKRTVALKFLSTNLTADADAKQRFIHEAQAASALQHTNICTIHEIDETAEGQMYICMDFYTGETLKKKIERGPLKIEQDIDIALQIAQGLAVAHEAEEIHRDIKPANIMITERGEIKIVDFGLARLAGQTRLTIEGKTVGTVAYMSPQQARGEEVDQRTDIWSLGVVLYEMLTGRLPFRGEYEQGVIYSIINETPEPVTAARTGVPMELERLVEKCLAKDPRERYQHMDELIVDLNRVKKEPELRSGVSKTEHGKEVPAKERKNLIRLFAGILLAGIVVTGGYYILSGIIKTESAGAIKSIAILPFDDLSPAKDQEYFCDGMTEQLTTNLSRLEKLRVRGRNSVMQFRNSDKTISRIARELKVDYILEGSIRKDDRRLRVTVQLIKGEDDYHLWAQDYDRQLDDMFDVQDDIAGMVTEILLTKLSADEKKKIKTHKPVNKEAYEYLMKGKYYHGKCVITDDTEDFAAAEKMLLKAVEMDPDYAEAYVELADLYNSYYFMKAKTDDEKARYMMLQEQFLRQASLLDSGSAEFNRVRGSFYAAKNEPEKAYFYIKRSVELDNRNPVNNSQFGYFFNTIGLYEQAIKYCLRAIEIDPLDLYSYTEIINSYWNADQLDQAEIYCRKSLEIDPGDAYIYFIYARILYDMKQYDRFEETRLKVENMDADPVHIKYLRSLHHILRGEKEKALSAWDKPYGSGLSGFLFMRVCDHFRMNDEFIQHLQEDFKRLEKMEVWYLWLKNATLFDNLRSDPRFQELLEKHRRVFEENLRKYPDIGD